jgi:hypothetical protein
MLLLALVLGTASHTAAQMADNVETPRVEVALGKPIHKDAFVPGAPRWTMAGGDAALTGNLTGRIGIDAHVMRTIGTTWLFLGARVHTGFFYGSQRDPIPGRFFLELLGGVSVPGRDGRTRPAALVGAGTDLMVLPKKGISIRWELVGHTRSSDPVGPSRCHFIIGLLIGPRLTKAGSR